MADKAPHHDRRWMAPLAALMALAVIAIGAVWADSVTRQQVSLDDGTVWVTSSEHRKAARFNVALGEADAAVSASATRFDVAQHGNDMILDEGSSVSSVAASTLGTGPKAATDGSTAAMIGGATTALCSRATGKVWIGQADTLDAMTPSSDPKMTLGSGGMIAVDDHGTVYGYRPRDGMILVAEGPASSKARRYGSLSDGRRLDVDDFTVIAGIPVVVARGTIRWSTGSASTGAKGRLRLQAPPYDGEQRQWVAAAGQGALYLADLVDGVQRTRTLPSGGTGNAAKPVSVGGCVYAAWSQRARNHARVCTPNGSGNGSGNSLETDDDPAVFDTLEEIGETSDLVFRTNHRLVLLNDAVTGDIWNPAESTGLIRIQWNTVRVDQPIGQPQDGGMTGDRHEFSASCSAESGKIRAEDDAFGARAGSMRILDVLRNDEQTDCSVLRIIGTGAPVGADISVSPVYGGRYLQLDATRAAVGEASVSYDIGDGRGQTSTATVTITLVGPSSNAEPAQTDLPTEYEVEQGSVHTSNALGGFADPDGDPLTLVAARATNSDQVAVSTRADGQLTFDAAAATSGRISVEVTVSDGQATGTGMVYFSIRPANTLAAYVDAVVGQTSPGTRTTVDLKPYVHGTSAQSVRLSAVDAPDGAHVTAHTSDLSFSFLSTEPGTYYVPFTVMQGSVPAHGLARIEVQPVTGESARPVAANDIAMLGPDRTAIVEPLTNDVDPMGGVLSVTAVSSDHEQGIVGGLVSNKRVYLVARRIPIRPVSITYTVANAAGASQGTIVLHPPAPMADETAPRAPDIDMRVRTGGIVSVDALDHVSFTGRSAVSLSPDLQYDRDAFKGLVFVSGSLIRYQASSDPGEYRVTYTVTDSSGNASSGTLAITVHERDAGRKAAPTPLPVEAQVAAGRRVRIPIELSGIDVDGDDVILLGLGNRAPAMGRITEVGSDSMLYEAYADSSGTDTFTYAVEDWTGQRAQGDIRVGIFRDAPAAGVVARDDEVTLRPGVEAVVPVTRNDIAADGEPLTVSGIDAPGLDQARAVGDAVSFVTPDREGLFYVTYTASDAAGLSDAATLAVSVDPLAAIEPPVAHDYRVPAVATIDRKSVDVDIAQWIANPSGTVDELEIGVDPSAFEHARVRPGARSTTISVDLTDEPQSIAYTVTNTTHGITSAAFVQVPAYGVFPPMLRPKAPPLEVRAGGTLIIAVADHVRVGVGKTAYVADESSASATKAANGSPYVDDHTLRFVAPKDYAGPASVTFTAADGKPGDGGRTIISTAVLTLPITVIGDMAPPPVFSPIMVDVAAGEPAMTIDLTKLTLASPESCGPDRPCTYALDAAPDAIAADISPSGLLTVSAPKEATPGTIAGIPFTIGHRNGSVRTGVTARIIASNRPLARIGAPTIRIAAGSSAQVDLLSDAYNPFPDVPLSMIGCVGAAPPVVIEGCEGTGPLTIRVDDHAEALSTAVTVTVRDGTLLRDRQVSAQVTVSVVGRPGAPLLSPVTGRPENGSVALSWTPGAANGSPVTDYQVLWSGGSKSCGAVTACNITGLVNGTEYVFTVRARNEAGWSDPSAPVAGMPDIVPTPPTGVTVAGGYHTLTVRWEEPRYAGTPPDGYTVAISGSAGGASLTRFVNGTAAVFTIPDEMIADGATFGATVTGRNRAGDGQPGMSDGVAAPWGNPDGIGLSLTQAGDGIIAEITIGDLRNAGCSGIVLSGDAERIVDCAAPRARIGIPRDKYHAVMTVTATLATRLDVPAARSDTARITPLPDVPDITDIDVTLHEGSTATGEGGSCTVSWQPSGGLYDRFAVRNASGETVSATGSTARIGLVPWRPCGPVTIFSVLNGTESPGVTGSESRVWKVPAVIGAGTAIWSPTDHAVVEFPDLHINAWDQRHRVDIIIRSDGRERVYPLRTGNHIVVDDFLDDAAPPWYWTVRVSGDDPALNAVSATAEIQGWRIPASPSSGRLWSRPGMSPLHGLSVGFTEQPIVKHPVKHNGAKAPRSRPYPARSAAAAGYALDQPHRRIRRNR